MKRLSVRGIAFALTLVILLSMPLAGFADNADKSGATKIRVGYMNQPSFLEDGENGEITGYCADYLERICEHTLWEIEYVYAPWLEQLDMLEKGELDIVPMAQYSEERAERFLFTHQPVGIIQCLFFCLENDNSIAYNDYSAFDGKTIGIQRGSHNIQLLESYAEHIGFSYKLREYTYQNDIEDAIERGEIDIIACEQMVDADNLRVLGHYGSDPYYFITAKNNEALMKELDFAISEINSHDPIFENTLYNKHFGERLSLIKPFFSKKEADFIKASDTITLALIPGSAPFSYFTPDGEPHGIIYDIFENISEISGFNFEYVPVPLDIPPLKFMMDNPEIILSGIVSTNPAFKEAGSIVSDSYYSTCCSIAFHSDKQEELDLNNRHYTIGTTKSFQMMHNFIRTNYPNLKLDIEFDTVEDGLKAVADGKIDLFTYEINTILPLVGSPRLAGVTVIPTSFMPEDHASAAMPTKENEIIISIINKCVSAIPQTTLDKIEKENIQKNFHTWTNEDTLYALRVPFFISLLIISFSVYIIFLTRKKNKQLAHSVMLAEHAAKVKSDFLSRMSHDIRTPMNAIIGMTELLKSEVADRAKAMEYITKIQTSSSILLKLLNDILDSTAIERGKLRISSESFDIRQTLLALSDLYTLQCENKGIEFSCDVAEMEHPVLIGDPLRLEQILMNILSNAYKFTEPGGKLLFKAEESAYDGEKAMFKFTITDTGCGMNKEMLERAFAPFEQKDASTAHKYGGSGLGLNIVSNLVSMMDGSINVESTVGDGTVFTVCLPFVPDTQHSIETISETSEQKQAYDFTGRHILIADDDAFNRDVLSGLLEAVGAEVDCASNGKEAIDKYMSSEGRYYDALILDVHMPITDGHNAARLIRGSTHINAENVPIFALTADAFAEDIEKTFESGMTGHLSKPIYPSELYAALHKVLDKGGADK